MARIRDEGHVAVADKPIRFPVHAPHAVDAAQVGAGAGWYVNDRKDGVPRGRMAFSNGATEDLVAYVDDIAALQSNLNRVEALAKAAVAADRASVAVTTVPSNEVEALHRRVGPLEQAVRELRGDYQTLQGGLRRLADAAPTIAAPSTTVPAGPSPDAVVAPPKSIDLIAALLPIEKRLSDIEAALELEVLANLAADALGGDATSAALIAEDAAILGITPAQHMDGIAKMRRQRHAAVMQARQKRLKG